MFNWKEMMRGNVHLLQNLFKGNDALMQAMVALDKSTAANGALDPKTRELVSLAVAATTRCEGCIAIHAEQAVKSGATREELLETLAVAVNLNAGAAAVYSSRILDAYDQFAGKK